MIALPILMEILQGVQGVGSFLNFIKDNERGPLGNGKSRDELERIKNPADVFGLCKELQVFRVFIEVEVGDFLILPLPKLLEQPRFFHLTYPCKIRGVR